MLARTAYINNAGIFVKNPDMDIKQVYATMLHSRVAIVSGACTALGQASTIAIRYSAIRRQFRSDPLNKKELKILDYPTQQHRILIPLASAFAAHFTGIWLMKLTNESMEGKKGTLAEVHNASSGLKCLITMIASSGIEECRKACGGIGYSKLSGLCDLMTIYLQFNTVEGENYVLSQQLSKYLLKSLSNRHDALLPPSLSYIRNAGSGFPQHNICSAENPQDFLNPNIQLEMYAFYARSVVFTLSEIMETISKKSGMSSSDLNSSLFQQYQMQCHDAAMAHSSYLIAGAFIEGIQDLESSSPYLTPTILSTLQDLRSLFLLSFLISSPVPLSFVVSPATVLLSQGYLQSYHLKWIQETISELLHRIRNVAVPLVDGFGFSDHYLASAIGGYEGNVYQDLWKMSGQGEGRWNPESKVDIRAWNIIQDIIRSDSMSKI